MTVQPCMCALAQSRSARDRVLALNLVRALLPLGIVGDDALAATVFPLLAAAATDVVPNIRLGAARALEVRAFGGEGETRERRPFAIPDASTRACGRYCCTPYSRAPIRPRFGRTPRAASSG